MLYTLSISPEAYYDLTGPETDSLLEGAQWRHVEELRQTRIIATLLRNAHFKDPVKDTEYMPLPGDEEMSNFKKLSGITHPEVAFHLLASAFPGELIIEDTL